MNNPKISVITVVKNGMPYLSDCLKSFELQDYANKEHIIIYSNSNDATEEFLLSQKKKNKNFKKG
jgi:glycosyltransferase involved in cell wall biosynthesis